MIYPVITKLPNGTEGLPFSHSQHLLQIAEDLSDKNKLLPYNVDAKVYTTNRLAAQMDIRGLSALFDALDALTWNIGLTPHPNPKSNEFNIIPQLMVNKAIYNSSTYGVIIHHHGLYKDVNFDFMEEAVEFEELKTVALTLQENNKHVVRVFKSENTLLIMTNKCTWGVILKAKALQLRFFKDQYFTYNTHVEKCYLALAENDMSTFYEYYNKILDYATWFKYKNKRLKECFKSTKTKRLANQKRKLDDLATDIELYENQFKATLMKYQTTLEEYNLLYNSEDKVNAEEICDYLTSHRYIKDITVHEDGIIDFDIVAPITYFDPEEAADYRVEDAARILLDEVFVNKKYKMWTECTIRLNTNTFNTTALRRDGSERGYFPHPHLSRFGCQGNHPDEIRKWINNYDYIGCIEQIITMVCNLNFYDAAVINEMLSNLKYNFDSTLCFENVETGELVSFSNIVNNFEFEKEEDITDETAQTFEF